MNTHDAIRETMNLGGMVLKSYLGDLSDAELMTRPGPGCNHLAWQIGHLIASTPNILRDLGAKTTVELPAGFAAAHAKEQAGNDNPADFRTKAEYLELFDNVNAATLKELETWSDADLDQPAPEGWAPMFATKGVMFLLIATHPMMHAGQVVPVRRALGKPVVI